MHEQIHRRQVLSAAAAGVSLLCGQRVFAQTPPAKNGAKAPSPSSQPQKPPFSFYAFDNGLNGGDAKTMEEKVKLLKDLGYTGISLHLDHKQLPAWLDLLDKNRLELFALYCVPFLDDVADPLMGETIQRLKGRRTRLELAIRSKLLKPSDPQGDAKALDLVKRLSDLLAASGPVASIYPHAGFWTARAEDGLRLARAAGRKNFGTNLNLVHWRWTGSDKPLEGLLADLMPHLLTVTVNGLQSGPADANPPQKEKIVPLNEGDFDVEGFLLKVKAAGFRGPIGLQCWSIKGPSRTHLQASMDKWQQIRKKLEA